MKFIQKYSRIVVLILFISPLYQLSCNPTVDTPPTATLASPSDKTTNVSTSPSLSWNIVDGDNMSYNLYCDNNPNPTTKKNTTLIKASTDSKLVNFTISGLSYNTVYYWKVETITVSGGSSVSGVYQFTTQTQSVSNSATSTYQPVYITLYKVSNDNIVSPINYSVNSKYLSLQQNTTRHQEMWDRAKMLIPQSLRSYVKQYMIFAGVQPDGSAITGYVTNSPNQKTNMEWEFGLAADYAYDVNGNFDVKGRVSYTIIHEFGHIATLNNTQVDPTIAQAGCTSSYYFQGCGCSKSDSYINNEYQNYWQSIWADYTGLGGGSSAFYTKYKTSFVTQYASTRPSEDCAETFAYFVIKADQPSSSSTKIADQKIKDYYKYSDMTGYRDAIRSNTAIINSITITPYANKDLPFESPFNEKTICWYDH